MIATIFTPTDILKVDVVLRTKYSSNVEVTKFPVEQGSVISDNARTEPDESEIEILVSETDGNAAAVYQKLKDARGQLCDVVTRFETFKNMTPTHIEVPDDKDSGDTARITVQFREIKQVTLGTTTVATKRKKKGTQTPKFSFEED